VTRGLREEVKRWSGTKKRGSEVRKRARLGLRSETGTKNQGQENVAVAVPVARENERGYKGLICYRRRG